MTPFQPQTPSALLIDEDLRRREFPVTADRIFMAHAGVAPLPKCAVDAIDQYCRNGSTGPQENAWTNGRVLAARQRAAELIGANPDEIALLGPTALGLSLVANGLDWQQDDEVVYYADDYPSNVYPWTQLEYRGVVPVQVRPALRGVITWPDIEPCLSNRTRLVSLATCHFLSGYRIDVDGIGERLHQRGILFCLDAIQTLGAFPLSVRHVDFLSADSHKWLLGPAAAGIVYVRREHQERLRPSLLGAWNVQSPGFVAQPELRFEQGARRYEPGILNLAGIVGMLASMQLLLDFGIDAVAQRLTSLRQLLRSHLLELGYRFFTDGPEEWGTAIVTVTNPNRDMKSLFKKLEADRITASFRHDRSGTPYIRFSPHFYNTEEEIEATVRALRD